MNESKLSEEIPSDCSKAPFNISDMGTGPSSVPYECILSAWVNKLELEDFDDP